MIITSIAIHTTLPTLLAGPHGRAVIWHSPTRS